LEQLKKELHSTKSDIIKKAIEYFIKQQEEEKLEKAVALMEDEYKNNRELTYLTALDSEDFK
jgi:predicted DNA-binding protein